MNPFVGLILIFVCLIAAIVWILLYFFLIERLLKKIVGAIFGVTNWSCKARGKYEKLRQSEYLADVLYHRMARAVRCSIRLLLQGISCGNWVRAAHSFCRFAGWGISGPGDYLILPGLWR